MSHDQKKMWVAGPASEIRRWNQYRPIIQALGNHLKIAVKIRKLLFHWLKGTRSDQASDKTVCDGIKINAALLKVLSFSVLPVSPQEDSLMSSFSPPHGFRSLQLPSRIPKRSISVPAFPAKSPQFILIGQDQVTCEAVTASRKIEFPDWIKANITYSPSNHLWGDRPISTWLPNGNQGY